MICAINPSIYSEFQKLSLLFRTAIPFPHVVIDNFLDESVAEGLLKDFPKVSLMHRSHHYLFANKYELCSWNSNATCFGCLQDELLSKQFASFVSKMSGKTLFMDSSCYLDIHQGLNGSFLDMHTDFTLHPYHSNWIHQLNVMIYLNKNWKQEYGGYLRLKGNLNETITEIAPLFNRCVIMLSNDVTYHGYNRMILPKDVTRKSILANFYEEESFNMTPKKPTTWVPEKTLFKSRVAKLYNPVAVMKKRFFG